MSKQDSKRILSDATLYRRLLGSTRRYMWDLVFGISGTIVLSLMDAGLTWLLKPITDQGFIHKDTAFLALLPLVTILIFIVRGIAGYASNYYTNRASRSVVRDFREEIFAHLSKMPASFYDEHNSGGLLSLIIYNVEQVATATSTALLTFLREFSLAIGLVIVMFAASWQLSLLVLSITPLVVWVMRICSARMRKLSVGLQHTMSDVTRVAREMIDHYKIMRVFGAQSWERERFKAANRDNRQREIKVVSINGFNTGMIQFLLSLPLAVMLYWVTLPSLHISAGSFVAVLAALISILRPARRLTLVNSDIQKGMAGAESIYRLLDQPEEVDNGVHSAHSASAHSAYSASALRTRGHIAFRHVSFAYASKKNSPALADIDIEILPKQTIAIVGHSGSGKTTLVSLLPRFYDVTSGSIALDGVDLRDYSLADLRAQFAWVGQEACLFNATVAENIAYGQTTLDIKRITEAAEMANAMEFIAALPQGLHTPIGESGVLLSGGQRQRIAIARALLKRAPILILDEATSSLDTHSERAIQQALERMFHDQTTIIIAHRLSTIEKADWILVMEKGRIVEQGTHQELLRRQSHYASLHAAQFSAPTQEKTLVDQEITA